MAAGDHIIIEFIQLGNSVKVTAICEETGVEVSIVGDPNAPRAQLSDIAARKLRHVLQKRSNDGAGNSPVDRGNSGSAGRGGKDFLV